MNGASFLREDIKSWFPGMKGRLWREEHDVLLLKAILKHGYARWQSIVEDKDLGIAEIVRQELNLPVISGPFNGGNHTTNGANSGPLANGSSEATRANQSNPDYSMLYQFRELTVAFVYVSVEVKFEASQDPDIDPKATEILVQNQPNLTHHPKNSRRWNPLVRFFLESAVGELTVEHFCDGKDGRVEMISLYNGIVDEGHRLKNKRVQIVSSIKTFLMQSNRSASNWNSSSGIKRDVMKDLPPKKELILRVDLKGVEPETEPSNADEGLRQLLDSSVKMQLLDKMMVKLKLQGHRVLIYSQFQHMLDLLEDYLSFKKWNYERIDGRIGGAERQIRIDRFNAKNSTRFCFLLSTRAGGLGINLATADTVIIYDSDWNPHADLQAMARAHRLDLSPGGTIEERMMQMTKKKMILEHLVVGRLKAQTVNQEELDDIIRYGSKELFAEESDEAGKSRQIHYDDAAIDRLSLQNFDFNRDEIGADETSMDDEDDDLLKAFKELLK
ncbi:hypothetical protein HPP92_004610 [Vanilla planifolia]|uniref:Helicase C-terminal domain-containing protein n=1 Tax=Vanilla planifolia TaxID=51239 RepID=A0A835S219_VANPL|nr:hypothetical protein HPP92_004610 [Vanilla planifolia]